MKKNKQQFSFVNIGSSSLLTVFLILCLATFAILSLSTAKSDYTMAERFANHKTVFYQASNVAEDIAQDMDMFLEEIANEKTYANFREYQEEVEERLNGVIDETVKIKVDFVGDDLIISYNVLAFDHQESAKTGSNLQNLSVELLVNDYTQSETYYSVKKWQIIPANEWESDDSLNLMSVE